MKSYKSLKHGKIYRLDYRLFVFPFKMDDFAIRLVATKKITDISDRLVPYFSKREHLQKSIKEEDGNVIIQFEKIDDAKMFMLSFTDVIDSQGVKFE